MLKSIFQGRNMRKLSFLVLVLCVLVSLIKNQNAETKKSSSTSTTSLKWPYSSWDSFPSIFLSPLSSSSSSSTEVDDNILDYDDDDDGDDDGYDDVHGHSNRSLEYDFYRDSCPKAESVIREMVQDLYKVDFTVAPALLRLVFHDCFIEGCEASILLDAAQGMESEKDSPPNQNLRGFDTIDRIKSEIENVCPGLVSCADIIALAAREAVVLAGGPFYPLVTGRRDGVRAYRDVATYEIPSPNGGLSDTLSSFASRGFDERETVSLLGAHSIGVIHCRFIQNRLYNFGGTNKPDPSVDTGFLNLMRLRCSNSSMAPSPSSFDGSKSPSTAPSLSCKRSPCSPSEAPVMQGSPPSSAAPEMMGSPSTSAAPEMNGIPSLSAAPEMNGSPSSSAAPSPSFKDSISSPPSSLAAPSPSFKDSISFPPSSLAAPSPSFKDSISSPPSSSAAPSPSFKDSISSPPSSAAAPSASFEYSMVSSPKDPGINMAYEGPGVDFGTLYYRSLLQGKGILYADQQLMAGHETGIWVRAYASDVSLFRRDFALSMMKLSSLGVLTGSSGQVRRVCSKIA